MAAVPIYLIFGSDEYLVSGKAKEIIEGLVSPEERALGLETISGQVSTIDEAIQVIGRCLEALQTVGFFGSRKVIWLRDANFFSDTPAGKSESVKTRVGDLTKIISQGLQGDNVFVVTAAQVDKRYAFFKSCSAKGQVHEFAVSDKAYQAERDAGARLQEQLKQASLTMRGDVLELFLQKVGTDTRQIVNEIDKLATYMGTRHEVNRSDVEAVTSSSRQALAWDLADAVGNRELSRAIDLIRQLLFQSRKEAPMRLIMSIEGRIRELALYREAIDRKWLLERGGPGGRKTVTWGRLPDDVETMIASDLGRDPRSVHPFRQGLLALQARKFTAAELRRAHRAVLSTCHGLLTRSISEAGALELLLVQILAKPASRS